MVSVVKPQTMHGHAAHWNLLCVFLVTFLVFAMHLCKYVAIFFIQQKPCDTLTKGSFVAF